MNLIPFAIGLAKDHRRIVLGIVMGALMCYPVASCNGRKAATAEYAAKVEVAAAKVEKAASKAEMAATLSEMARSANTQMEVTELRKVVSDAKDDGPVGGATGAVIERLRRKRGS